MGQAHYFSLAFIKDFNSETSCSGKDLEDFLGSVMPDTSPDACQAATEDVHATEDATHSVASGSGMEVGSVKERKKAVCEFVRWRDRAVS